MKLNGRAFGAPKMWTTNKWSLAGSTIRTLLHEKSTLKIDRYCPLVMQGFSYSFKGCFK